MIRTTIETKNYEIFDIPKIAFCWSSETWKIDQEELTLSFICIKLSWHLRDKYKNLNEE